jgi:hypothetical protein
MNDITWLLLTYKVLAEPSTKRIAIWPRLKGMGLCIFRTGSAFCPARMTTSAA